MRYGLQGGQGEGEIRNQMCMKSTLKKKILKGRQGQNITTTCRYFPSLYTFLYALIFHNEHPLLG